MDTKRFYRDSFKGGNLTFFSVSVEQTDLYIGAKKNLYQQALTAITKFRHQLEAYIKVHPDFLNSLKPVCPLPNAPLIAVDMCTAANLAGVGPMAAVAGSFSKFIGQELLKYSDEIIVENGGDIFMQSLIDRTIGIYAGDSPLNGELAIRIS